MLTEFAKQCITRRIGVIGNRSALYFGVSDAFHRVLADFAGVSGGRFDMLALSGMEATGFVK